MLTFCHFSAPADYELLAARHEQLNNLYFVPMFGTYPTPEYPVFEGLLSLPELGVINRRYHEGERYFVFTKRPKLRMKRLPPLDGGGVEYELAGSLRVCVEFTPNGLWGDCVICGIVRINNNVEASRPLYDTLRACFVAEYLIGEDYCDDSAYVGPAALALHDQGFRLTGNPNLVRSSDYEPRGNRT